MVFDDLVFVESVSANETDLAAAGGSSQNQDTWLGNQVLKWFYFVWFYAKTFLYHGLVLFCPHFGRGSLEIWDLGDLVSSSLFGEKSFWSGKFAVALQWLTARTSDNFCPFLPWNGRERNVIISFLFFFDEVILASAASWHLNIRYQI